MVACECFVYVNCCEERSAKYPEGWGIVTDDLYYFIIRLEGLKKMTGAPSLRMEHFQKSENMMFRCESDGKNLAFCNVECK